MSVLDFLRAAIQPTAAARAGYLKGQEIARERDQATARQSLLDQIKASVDASTIQRNDATAARLGRGNDAMVPTVQPDGSVEYTPSIRASGKTVPPKPGAGIKIIRPNVVNPLEGTVEDIYSDGSRRYVRDATADEITRAKRGGSGAGGGASQERLDAKTALDEALKKTPRPSKTPAEITNPEIFNAPPGTDIKKLPVRVHNPAYDQAVSDSTAYERNVLSPLRDHLNAITVPDVLSQPDSAAMTPASPARPAPKPAAHAQIDPARAGAMQAEFAAASANLQAVLGSNAPDAVKQQARALYNQQQQSIAKKYGATSTQP